MLICDILAAVYTVETADHRKLKLRSFPDVLPLASLMHEASVSAVAPEISTRGCLHHFWMFITDTWCACTTHVCQPHVCGLQHARCFKQMLLVSFQEPPFTMPVLRQ